MLIKPPMWGVEPGLVAPEWGYFWNQCRFCAGFMPSAAFGFDLSQHRNNLTQVGATITTRVTERGSAYDFATAPNIGEVLVAADSPSLSITGEITVTAVFIKDSDNTNNNGIVSKYLGTGDNRSFILATDEQGGDGQRVQWGVGSSGTFGTVVFVKSADAAITYGKIHTVVCRYIPSVSLKLNIDGVETTNTTSIPASCFDSTADLWLGMQFVAVDVDRLIGAISFASVHAGAWSDVEVDQFIRDPFGPIRRRLH